MPTLDVEPAPLPHALRQLARRYLEECQRVAARAALVVSASLEATMRCLDLLGSRRALEACVIEFALSPGYAALRMK